MPPDAVAEIQRAASAALVNEDGDPVELDLAPAMPETEIKALEADIGLALPRELRRVLMHTAGIDGIEPIDFTGGQSFEMDWIFPSGFPIAADGFGNFWVVDLVPGETEAAPVFYASHDPPVILYQSPNIAHYLRETFRLYTPPHTSLVYDVHEDRPFDVWRKNPGAIDQPAALASEDEPLRDFASTLDERFSLVDLRSPQIGMGFSWGRYGPGTEVRRHGYERLFAYGRPRKKPGLLRRLLD